MISRLTSLGADALTVGEILSTNRAAQSESLAIHEDTEPERGSCSR